MKRLSILILILAVVLLATVACGGGQSGPAPASPNSAPAAPTDKSTSQTSSGQAQANQAEAPTATPASSQQASGQGSSSAEDLSLSSRDAGLDKLKSYRIRWQSQWNTTDQGKTQSANWDWSEEYSSSPEALHWSWKYNDVGGKNTGSMEAWQVGDTTYMVTADASKAGQCLSFSSQDANQKLSKGLFTPSSLGSISDAKFVGNEQLNGLATKHYQYNQSGITLAGMGQVAGEVWVAVDGGYVVKDQLKWQGSAGLFGESSTSKGDGQWTWELTDANKPITITPPADCEGAANSLPMMSDAREKNSIGDMLMYKTASSVSDTAVFYNKQMPAAGWKVEGEPMNLDNMATLSFAKDNKKAQVSITSDNGETQVIITVTK